MELNDDRRPAPWPLVDLVAEALGAVLREVHDIEARVLLERREVARHRPGVAERVEGVLVDVELAPRLLARRKHAMDEDAVVGLAAELRPQLRRAREHVHLVAERGQRARLVVGLAADAAARGLRRVLLRDEADPHASE